MNTTMTQASTKSLHEVIEHYVTSKDGTRIGYRRVGQGPGVVVVHGASSSGYNHVEMAQALADEFTVYLMDRRGRGLSGPFGADYTIQKEVDDLDALLRATQTENVFGVSAGGVITLTAASRGVAIRKAAIYETPFRVGIENAPWLARYEREIAEQKWAAALVTGMLGGELGAAFMQKMPRWFLEAVVGFNIWNESRNGARGYVPMRDLAPTLHYDFALVLEMNARLEEFKAIRAKVLLMSGTTSAPYLMEAMDRLEPLLPHATRVRLDGLDHAASWNKDMRGNPLPVAEAVRGFLR